MPLHSSHLLQPLDVGSFMPLKVGYGRQAENLMRSASITKNNIPGAFRGAGLVLFDPETVISKLDVRLRIPTPSTIENASWQSQKPRNTLDLGHSQSRFER